MAKAKQRVAAGRLAGKRVLFQGKFGWGDEDRLRDRAEIQGATLAKALDAKLDYLVLPDATAGKTARQKAQSLIAKGAGIRVLDADDFGKLVEPTDGDLLNLIRGGKQNAGAFRQALGGHQSCVSGTKDKPTHTFAGENFDGLDLSDFDFDGIAFEDCRFVGATLNRTDFDLARGCDFSTVRPRAGRPGPRHVAGRRSDDRARRARVRRPAGGTTGRPRPSAERSGWTCCPARRRSWPRRWPTSSAGKGRLTDVLPSRSARPSAGRLPPPSPPALEASGRGIGVVGAVGTIRAHGISLAPARAAARRPNRSASSRLR